MKYEEKVKEIYPGARLHTFNATGIPMHVIVDTEHSGLHPYISPWSSNKQFAWKTAYRWALNRIERALSDEI